MAKVATLVQVEKVVPKLAYTVSEAAYASGLGKSTIYELLAKGVLPRKKHGATTLIPAPEFEAYILALPTSDAA